MNSTICAISTAQGGAIGIIRISGSEAIAITNKVFKPLKHKAPLTEAHGYTLHYGQIVDDGGAIIDDVLVTLFRAPHSYTGEDSVEISCHGSSYILHTILDLLITNGCRLAAPGEYTQRAYLNGKLDLTQAEAVADLIASQTKAQHHVAMQQMRGQVSTRLSQLRDKLLTMTSLLELELDFSEEDVEFADRLQLMQLASDITSEITRLVSSFATGNAIKNGIPVAIIGAPNVGKSTLLNALLGDERAIVSDIQGTTRDVIEDTITIDGRLYRFLDTAGIRQTTDTIEQIGIERSLSAASRATIIIMLTEPGVPYPEIDIRPDQHVIRITNKTPKFQAINGTGLPELLSQLSACHPHTDEGTILITNLRHKQALELALTDIQRATQALGASISGDLVAEDLRACLSHLGEILGGEITPNEVLGNIFKNFCIGK